MSAPSPPQRPSAGRIVLSRRQAVRLVLCAISGASVGVCAWYLGMDAAHATGLGAVTAAFVACLSLLGEASPIAWPPEPVPPRAGSRRDVVQLGWALGARGGKASPEGVRRIRLLAARALAGHGVNLDDPADADEVERLLGAPVVALLERGSPGLRTTQIGALLGRLEELAPPAPPSRPDARRSEESNHVR